ncbi:hypothetical protein [Tautonia rosea]|uniref:hypothetical protein n=1 Tax=Tautonia rosea TaxID=2728037 RepID=UPI00147271C7|nr:hypothetical protein [Tautonia rosea]
MTFRSLDWIATMGDLDAHLFEGNADQVYWHSCAQFISDNVATQLYGLAHVTAGADHHWYNEFLKARWEGGIMIRVHTYLLVDQGVHIFEFHHLEEQNRDKVYEFSTLP